MIDRYAVVRDSDVVVVNIILWDGKTPYEPPEGLILRPAKDGDCIDEPTPLSEDQAEVERICAETKDPDVCALAAVLKRLL